MMDCTKLSSPMADDDWDERKEGLKADRKAARDTKARAKGRAAASAAGELWATSEWSGERLRVDAHVLLGRSLTGAPEKWFAFVNCTTAAGAVDLGIEGATLRKVRHVLGRWLQRTQVEAWFEGGRMHVRWRDGKGGLDLWLKQVPASVEVFNVVLPSIQEKRAS